MRHQGRLTTWKDDKGFGFITPERSGEQIFVHINAFVNRQRRPESNDLVTYECGLDKKGRVQAKAVAFVGERHASSGAPGRSKLPPLFAVSFLVLVTGTVITGRLPVDALLFYVALSFVAFFAYALDKSAASRNRWRTQESTLHLFALLGGWPGAVVAQRLLRHKSAKTSFQVTFWVTVALNCTAFGWLLSSSGTRALNAVLGAIAG